MHPSNDLSKARTATQLVFLICGLGISAWAPMVPFVRDRLHLNDADLGLLLLLLGLGAMLMMPISGMLLGRLGSRTLMAVSTLSAAVILPLFLVIPNYAGMGLALFLFGCNMGVIDVAMNTHGVQVQRGYGRPIMSSLHGLYSVGGLFGSLGLGLLIKMELNPLHAAMVIAILLIAILVSQYKYLFDYATEQEIMAKYHQGKDAATGNNGWQWLNKTLLLLGFMCFSVFLSEGAMLDWGAIFLRDLKNIAPEFAGAGYAAFSFAMAGMRLTGDRIIERTSPAAIVIGGSLVAAAGIGLMIIASWLPLVLIGFILVGLGASNIVPIFFSESGNIKGVTPTVGIAVMTTMGYGGALAGPAVLGYIAHDLSLEAAFALVAALMVLVAILYGMGKCN
jgi:predicted MFS family arabinose efflux permease